MDDYGSNAALGFIQGSIIGRGINEATNAYRNGLAARREIMEIEQDYFNLRAQYINLRNQALDLEIALRNKDSHLAVAEAEIARGKHEIALRDHEIAKTRTKLHQTEDRLAQEKDSHACTTKAWKNLIYTFNHYRRLLKIPENGGDAYDFAWEAWWSPDHVPPEQRSEPKK